jgi:hypothetical protein
MYFGLLVTQISHQQETHTHHNAVADIPVASTHRFATLWRAFRKLMA